MPQRRYRDHGGRPWGRLPSRAKRVVQFEPGFRRYLLRKKLGLGGMAERFLPGKTDPGRTEIDGAVKRILSEECR